MFVRKIINFIRSIGDALRGKSQSENIKPVSITVRAPTMSEIKYGVPKIIPKK